jgi:uncharacterized membrane protein
MARTFTFSNGTTSVQVTAPSDWDMSIQRPMEVARTLSSAIVSAWPKIVAGKQPKYSQQLTDAQYSALAALDDGATTELTLTADGSVYTVVLDITKAQRVYRSGQAYRNVEATITIVEQLA